MELHFYPGYKKLIIKENGKITWRFDAWGGPQTPVDDATMRAMPTTPGKYVIDSVAPYFTPTWDWSKLKWGTLLQDKPSKQGIKDDDDVWYLLPSGRWGSISKDFGIKRSEIVDNHELLYGQNVVPEKWIFNDFGPLAIRYFVDINHNMKLDKNKGEKLSGEMIHTTPENEAQTLIGKAVNLGYSHGCIHIKPIDRDTMQAMGVFQKGTVFVVHKYSEFFE